MFVETVVDAWYQIVVPDWEVILNWLSKGDIRYIKDSLCTYDQIFIHTTIQIIVQQFFSFELSSVEFQFIKRVEVIPIEQLLHPIELKHFVVFEFKFTQQYQLYIVDKEQFKL